MYLGTINCFLRSTKENNVDQITMNVMVELTHGTSFSNFVVNNMQQLTITEIPESAH